MGARVSRSFLSKSLVVIATASAFAAGYGRMHAQQNPAPARTAESGQVHVLPVQGNVSMLVGAGANVTVSIGEDGVLVVDSGAAANSAQLLAAIRTVSDKPIRFILNTSVDADHVGGNGALGRAGGTGAGRQGGAGREGGAGRQGGGAAAEGAAAEGGGNRGGRGGGVPDAIVIADEHVLTRMLRNRDQPGPPGGLSNMPPSITYSDNKDVYFNSEAIMLTNERAAHTDGDSLIFFRKSDVISTGDLFMTTTYPVIDLQRGGSINGEINALNHIIDIAVPKNLQEGGTQIIPGHGRLCEESDVVEYRDMVTIIRDRILEAVKKGMTLEQVKAARLTRDYDPRYGAASGAWTTDMFVEAVYRTANQHK